MQHVPPTGLTLAGVSVAPLGRSPGQVIVEVITLLTVQALCVVVTHTPAVNLDNRRGSETLRQFIWNKGFIRAEMTPTIPSMSSLMPSMGAHSDAWP